MKLYIQVDIQIWEYANMWIYKCETIKIECFMQFIYKLFKFKFVNKNVLSTLYTNCSKSLL